MVIYPYCYPFGPEMKNKSVLNRVEVNRKVALEFRTKMYTFHFT